MAIITLPEREIVLIIFLLEGSIIWILPYMVPNTKCPSGKY